MTALRSLRLNVFVDHADELGISHLDVYRLSNYRPTRMLFYTGLCMNLSILVLPSLSLSLSLSVYDNLDNLLFTIIYGSSKIISKQ